MIMPDPVPCKLTMYVCMYVGDVNKFCELLICAHTIWLCTYIAFQRTYLAFQRKYVYQNLRNLVNVAISNIWIVIQIYKPKCYKIIDAV